ncbi:hypothetical protein RAB80_014036 [Fusarium oxysporum f. sp. vasinfectum]|nr:hypothetical protein RAB80_014036 [Fusarium oxysporum f. sp. vasinfectum]KAK2923146.1 hypothetical protein FoTM2_016668 [Fusarium oxysporum f. sp. vasinfectum]
MAAFTSNRSDCGTGRSAQKLICHEQKTGFARGSGMFKRPILEPEEIKKPFV